MNDWKFMDSPNVAVIADKKVLNDDGWIAYVCHDLEDGAWQFHSADSEVCEGDACIVSLLSIVQRDPAIISLADLPLGWHAWRESKASPWQRGLKKYE